MDQVLLFAFICPSVQYGHSAYCVAWDGDDHLAQYAKSQFHSTHATPVNTTTHPPGATSPKTR